MPPPATQSEQNPVVQSQLRELSSALTVMAQLSHAQSAHFRKTGEAAEKFGRVLDDARGNFQREMRDLVVAVHFTGESIARKARDLKLDQNRRTQRSDTDLHRHRQQLHWAEQRTHWAQQRAAWAERSVASQRGFGWGGAMRAPGGGLNVGGVRADAARPPRGPFAPSAEDIARGMHFARQRDKAAGRTAGDSGWSYDASRRSWAYAPNSPPKRLALPEHRYGSLSEMGVSEVPRGRPRDWKTGRYREQGGPLALSGPDKGLPGRSPLYPLATVPGGPGRTVGKLAFAEAPRLGVARVVGGRPGGLVAGLGGMAGAGPAVGAFVAALALGTTAIKTWADVLSHLVQAASPNVWRTFTGSIELLMAQVGTTLTPAFVRLAGAAQELADRFDRLSPKQKEAIGTGAGLAAAPFGLPGLIASGIWAAASAGALFSPARMKVDAKTNEPKFSAVESVWESMALGFLRDTDLQRAMAEIQQKQLDEMLRHNAVIEGNRKPGK